MTIEQFNKAKSCFERKQRVDGIIGDLDSNRLKPGTFYFKPNSYHDDQINLQCPPEIKQQIFTLLINHYIALRDQINEEIANI